MKSRLIVIGDYYVTCSLSKWKMLSSIQKRKIFWIWIAPIKSSSKWKSWTESKHLKSWIEHFLLKMQGSQAYSRAAYPEEEDWESFASRQINRFEGQVLYCRPPAIERPLLILSRIQVGLCFTDVAHLEAAPARDTHHPSLSGGAATASFGCWRLLYLHFHVATSTTIDVNCEEKENSKKRTNVGFPSGGWWWCGLVEDYNMDSPSEHKDYMQFLKVSTREREREALVLQKRVL